jgi:hypothetical protein
MYGVQQLRNSQSGFMCQTYFGRPWLSRMVLAEHSLSSQGQSGAKATALQTLARLLVGFRFREASGVRRVHRRFWAESNVGLVIG